MIWVVVVDIFKNLVESYLKSIYPLKKYNMIPGHRFLQQISSCTFTVLSPKFYGRVGGGILILQQSQMFSFCENGLNVNTKDTPLEADIVIFANGYRSNEKLMNIFTSTYFQNLVAGSSAPFYRYLASPNMYLSISYITIFWPNPCIKIKHGRTSMLIMKPQIGLHEGCQAHSISHITYRPTCMTKKKGYFFRGGASCRTPVLNTDSPRTLFQSKLALFWPAS